MSVDTDAAPEGGAPPGPRVALVMPGGFEFGGIGRVMLYVTQAWSRLPAAPRWRVLDARGSGSLVLAPLHLATVLATVFFLRAVSRLDLLHFNVAGRGSTLRKIALAEFAGLIGLPYVVHLHDYDYARDLDARGPIGRRLAVRLFRRAERVLVLGARDEATVTGRLGVPAGRVERLPNGVPDPGPPPARATRAGPVRLLFLGHLSARKGVPELLDALAGPELREKSWHLVLAGGGETERFAAHARSLGLAERVTLTGWLSHEHAYALGQEADILVLPSHAEGQAMALLEGMAHGLAIVTTPVGAHPETVQHEREALLVRPGDRDALRRALLRVIDDASLRAELGDAARRRYLERFTAERVAARLAAIHRGAARRGLSGAPTAERQVSVHASQSRVNVTDTR